MLTYGNNVAGSEKILQDGNGVPKSPPGKHTTASSFAIIIIIIMNWRKFGKRRRRKKYEKCLQGNQMNALKWKKAVEKFCLLNEEEDGKM